MKLASVRSSRYNLPWQAVQPTRNSEPLNSLLHWICTPGTKPSDLVSGPFWGQSGMLGMPGAFLIACVRIIAAQLHSYAGTNFITYRSCRSFLWSFCPYARSWLMLQTHMSVMLERTRFPREGWMTSSWVEGLLFCFIYRPWWYPWSIFFSQSQTMGFVWRKCVNHLCWCYRDEILLLGMLAFHVVSWCGWK